MEFTKLTVTVDEMSKLLGISKPIAYGLTKREGFPAIRISERKIVIPLDKLKDWLNTAVQSKKV